jgi:predicted transcriptional regulator YdeE
MAEHPIPVFRTIENVLLIGTRAIYDSQAEASERIPHQWREFRKIHPEFGSNSEFHGASPCTGDRRIHYLTGVAQEKWDGSARGEPLNLEAGEYAVVQVNDAALLRDTWIWLLGSWLPTSGRREKKAPEFEKYADISETGFPIGPVEIWIPLEPLATN